MIRTDIRVFNARSRDKTKKCNDKTLILIGEEEVEKAQNKIIDLLIYKYSVAWEVEPGGRIQFKLTESIAGELAEELSLWKSVKKVIEEDKDLKTLPRVSAVDLFNTLFTDEVRSKMSRLVIYTHPYRKKLK